MAFNPLPVVLSDLRRQRAVVLATLVLIALAVAMGMTVIALERALRQGSARAADDFDLVIGAPGSQTQLLLTAVYLQPAALPLLEGNVLARATAAPGVAYAAPVAFGDQWQGHPIVGTIAAFADRGGRLEAREGRIFGRRGEAVVGAAVDLPLGSVFHPAHGDGHDDDAAEHHELSYTVVGRLPSRHNIWDRAILVPVEDVWAAHGIALGASGRTIGPPWPATALPGVPAIAVKPRSVADAYRLRNEFRNGDSTAFFPAEELNELYGTLGDLRDLMMILAVACQILVVSAVLIVLLVGLAARRPQFAVLRAIGAGRGYIFVAIWLEVAALVVVGALVGTLAGYGASRVIGGWLTGRTGFALPIGMGIEEAVLMVALIVIGLVAAAIPAVLAFRQPVVAGLRGGN